MNTQATGRSERRQGRSLFKTPDLLTAIRLPLAAAFALVPGLRLTIVGVAAVSDIVDGIWARRIGGSRAGVVLDPIADKAFITRAFVVVAMSGKLGVLKVRAAARCSRHGRVRGNVDLAATNEVAGTCWRKSRDGLSVAYAVAWVLGSGLIQPLAWATAAISVYAVADYSRVAWST